MKGRITLQPLREDAKKLNEWPIFGKEEAVFGYLDFEKSVDGRLFTTDGDEIEGEDVYEFMVKLDDGSLIGLNHNNIDEAMDNDWWDYYSGMFGEEVKGKELDFEVSEEIATVVVQPVEMGTTARGFGNGKFKDQYGATCSIQASSIATKACIWLGINDAEPQIMASDAIKRGMDTEGQTTGWVKYPIPKEVLLSTRMHLSREDVKRLLPLLTKFAETGELS